MDSTVKFDVLCPDRSIFRVDFLKAKGRSFLVDSTGHLGMYYQPLDSRFQIAMPSRGLRP